MGEEWREGQERRSAVEMAAARARAAGVGAARGVAALTREREVEVALLLHRDRQRHRLGVAFSCKRLEGRSAAATDGQLEQPRHLVEGFAESIVER